MFEKIKELFNRTSRTEAMCVELKTMLEKTNEQNTFIISGLTDHTNLLKKQIDTLNNNINRLRKENEILKEELANQKRRLDFYLNIEDDSGNITENDGARFDSNGNAPIEDTAETESSFAIAANEPSLDSQQEQARKLMDETNENYFLSGKAGTGKSYLLDTFRNETQKKTLVLAPTGIAALNVRGATLHSAFGYYNLVKLNIEDISPKTIRLKSDKQLVLQEVETIIIDEISMVRADIFEKIDKILQIVNKNNAPFGGKQILLFGDLFQLPPVVTKKLEFEYLLDNFGGIYFFNSNSYKRGNFKYLELTQNHRQMQDKQYFELLNRVREGKSTSEDVDLLNSRIYFNGSIYDRFTTLFPTKAEAERVNKEHIQSLETKEYSYDARVVYDRDPNQNKVIESIFPITEHLQLKEGALVMMVANDTSHRWVNGTMGIIKKLANDRIYVSIDKQTYEVHRITFSEQEVIYRNKRIQYEDIFTVEQFPLVLAYAITIHKSQGQTLRNIICDINNCFATGQAYVALSRCSSLEGLHLIEPVVSSNIQVDHDVLDFYQTLENLLE